MACADIKIWSLAGIPKGSVYDLSAVGPAGAFSAFAEYDDPSASPIVHWGAKDIVNKSKIQPLPLAGHHFVHITVGTLVPGSAVQVKANVTFPDGTVKTYCRTVDTTMPSEKITHHVKVV